MKKLTARRAATFLAALGMLVMSSGVALMMAATPANAAPDPKVVVCKYVNSPGGTLDHIVIVADNTLPEAFAGNFPFEWTDAQGQSEAGSIAIRYAHEGEQAHEVSASECKQDEPQLSQASASATPVQATCDAAASYTTNATGATFTSTPPAVAGTTITLTATADAGYTFDGQPTKDISLTFDPAPTGCNQVPGVATATVTPNTPTCENNVASYSKTGEHVTFHESAAPAFGTTITVTATADEGFEFAGGNPTKEFSVTFPSAATGCDVQVLPPVVTDGGVPPTIVVSPPSSTGSTSSTVTPTVVHAGLAGVSTPDPRGAQGLALVFAGMLLLLGAGGLVVRTSGRMSRI